MKSTTIISLLTLLTLTSASPVRTVRTMRPRQLEDSDYCGNSTFVGETTGGSPLVSDCQALADSIGFKSWSELQIDGQETLTSEGGCAFGVEGTDDDDTLDFEIGNTDLINLVTSAIEQFAWTDENGDERVGASGVMTCSGEGSTGSEVTWGLYGTP